MLQRVWAEHGSEIDVELQKSPTKAHEKQLLSTYVSAFLVYLRESASYSLFLQRPFHAALSAVEIESSSSTLRWWDMGAAKEEEKLQQMYQDVLYSSRGEVPPSKAPGSKPQKKDDKDKTFFEKHWMFILAFAILAVNALFGKAPPEAGPQRR
jgi:hypothetical protein